MMKITSIMMKNLKMERSMICMRTRKKLRDQMSKKKLIS